MTICFFITLLLLFTCLPPMQGLTDEVMQPKHSIVEQ